MTDEAILQGTYHDLKLVRTRGVAQIIIEIPLEAAPAFVNAFGVPNPSEEIWVAVARLQGDSKPHSVKQDDGPKPKSYAQEAGILSNDKAFWRFVGTYSAHPVDDAA